MMKVTVHQTDPDSKHGSFTFCTCAGGGKNGTSRPFNGYWHRHPDSNRPVNSRSVSSLPSQCERVVEEKSPLCVCQRTDALPLSFYTYQFPLSLSFRFWWYDLRTSHARTNHSCESDLFNESLESLPKTAENDSLGIVHPKNNNRNLLTLLIDWLIDWIINDSF